MAITWDDVTGFAAELSDIPLVAQTAILAYVNKFSVAAWGDEETLFLGRVYMAAHLGTKQVQSSSGGGSSTSQVTSETVGGVSRTFKVTESDASNSNLSTTGYGQLWMEIASGTPARAPILLEMDELFLPWLLP
jgi:hypothetical protein